jgi:hypothetical protein
MKNKVLMGLAAIIMVAFLSSCGKVPQAKVDATNAAIAADRLLKQLFMYRLNLQLYRIQ